MTCKDCIHYEVCETLERVNGIIANLCGLFKNKTEKGKQMSELKQAREFFGYPKDEFKFDNGKPRCDLVPAEMIEAIGAVRTYGVQKYGEEYSYREVEPKRYRAALMRHICSWLKNPYGKDEESGLPHLWHVACNVAFLIELDKENGDDSDRIRGDAEEAEEDDFDGTNGESCC